MKLEKTCRILNTVLITILIVEYIGLIDMPKFAICRVTSGSMEPYLPTNSFTLIERVDQSDDDSIEVGDVVVYNPPEAWGSGRIIHRVIRKEFYKGQYLYRCKGDANAFADPYYLTSGSILYKEIRPLDIIKNK